jgi:hypothetical protein
VGWYAERVADGVTVGPFDHREAAVVWAWRVVKRAAGGGKRRELVPASAVPAGHMMRLRAARRSPQYAAGTRVKWVHSRFGWDAVLLDAQGHVRNSVNCGFPTRPTAGERADVERRLTEGLGAGLAAGKRRSAPATDLGAQVKRIKRLARGG